MRTAAPEPELPASSGRWELTPIGRDNWRLGDPKRRNGDAEHVIAFVERTELGWLEVLWLRDPCPHTSRFRGFAEMLSALEAAIAEASDPARPPVNRSRPPREIPHRPPL